ncbi:HupE/UreJ family protein [Rhizobium sp. P32RR-XVIII]|nr:HupE/UreJ family protein [Rhizobium sp. P32RR-XVIII]
MIALLAALVLPLAAARAHEVRPAYLQIDEIAPGRYQLLWRTPVLSGMRLPVVLRLPDDVRDVVEPSAVELSDSLIERHVLDAGPKGLTGDRIEFVGLQATITDVLVRVQLSDGTHSTTLVHPSKPWVDVPRSQGTLEVAATYLSHGINHILGGIDHLLFVFGLLLLVKGWRRVAATITAFTVAHSLTLAAATFGLIRLPEAPLNVAIAMSILILGVEIVKAARGEATFGVRYPWAIAFGFGLLHGCGFAVGLATAGLPAADIPFALLFFNLGVEIGQLAFVALFYTVLWAARSIDLVIPRRAELLPAYLVGTAGAYWTITLTARLINTAV